MKFIETKLQGAYVIELEQRGDARGFFARAFCSKEFQEMGLSHQFVQMNDSLSRNKGTLRGMHFQLPPHQETKLVRCIRGSLCDVILDLREDSPNFAQHVHVELTADNRRMLYVPKGFAHSFVTLENDTEALYLTDGFYAPEAERGVRWNDPFFGIKWPVDPTVISNKDASFPDFDPDYHLRGGIQS